LEALETAARRLGISAEEEAEVHFLIEQHLAMSATVQRRDIFDPSIVSGFAESVKHARTIAAVNAADLHADIHAVNSRSADTVESGNALAAFCGDFQPLQSHAGSQPAARVG